MAGKSKTAKMKKSDFKKRRCRGSNPGHPRDRREYSPLYYNDLDVQIDTKWINNRSLISQLLLTHNKLLVMVNTKTVKITLT